MKINDTQRIGAAQQYQRQQAMQRSAKAQTRKDEVSISTEAQQMLNAQNRVQDSNRADRIQELKQAVSTGTYHVEADKIAEKLLPLFREDKK
ncbi:flagellar biosynthesis anti-sigma factor FlgM [Paenibacillus sp. ACRRX]|uniref:flagellar biosynthesis anti-sigma factor FlgM n=1 Tax=Paenibacillus TaxID=44249 RepID=UPI000402F920|nr:MULTISPECIES: flagellar biosynthesis anti-sigma factor FlgM [Paenibacillus]MCG7407992.1 flagellar biosynthesis anti-sigma factor FlgM [Paenibacillus sp. ACRRX]MDK8181627.1 flagellar biosynthesis anti-sigma factor FlgM [Paenibacillus sp. UMB4589-SE434]